MITTTRQRGASDKPGRHILRTLLQLTLLALLVGCTNSKLIIGPLYNQLDDKILSKFGKLADFNAEQTEAFEQAVGTYHVWHRQSELPKYAAVMQDIASSIAVQERTTEADVERWINSAEGFSRAARACFPINFMTGTMRTLTDAQITTIQERLASERQKNRESRAPRNPEERVAYRLNNLEKWAGRINLELTQSQRRQITDSLSRQISLRQQHQALSDAWYSQLFSMARNNEAEDYETQLREHLARQSSLLETAYPDEWLANRQLWQETLPSFIQSLSDEQRRTVSQWTAKMGKTLQAISQDPPSFTPGTDSSVGCLVNNGS